MILIALEHAYAVPPPIDAMALDQPLLNPDRG
jgi:hypothetical protein